MPEPIVTLNEESPRADLRELIRKTVEETPSGLLEEEAGDLVGAERYERTADREAYRAGHCERRLATTSGEVTIRMPRLRGMRFTTAIMAMYEIEFSKEAVKHVLLMRKSSPQLFKKLEKLLDELREHPYTGTGHPEQLRYLEGVWSRQLDKKNRIRYMVNETTVIVFIISAWGHYDDK